MLWREILILISKNLSSSEIFEMFEFSSSFALNLALLAPVLTVKTVVGWTGEEL